MNDNTQIDHGTSSMQAADSTKNHDKITISLIQESPIFLNLADSIAKGIEAIYRAAHSGANVIGFAECWAPGYPVWLDYAPRAAIWNETGAKQLFRLLGDNAIAQDGSELVLLQKTADDTGAIIVFGAHERDGNTLYNTTFTAKPGLKAPLPHRKLIPTYTERLVWGRGDGSTLETVDTPYGTVGSLICWEHWMPLLRAAMHAKHETVHIAQWPTVNDVHQLASRHYAFEGRCAVGAAGSIMTKGDILSGFKSLKSNLKEAEAMLNAIPGEENTFIHSGGSAVIAPDASYVTEPVFEQYGIVSGDVDLSLIKEALQTLDTVGHYSRPDIFDLKVNIAPQPGISFESCPP